jgi:hypothetical protein
MRPAVARGGHVPAKGLIAYSSFFPNHDRPSALINLAASGGFIGLRSVSPISRISSRVFHNFQMTDDTNTPCAFLHGRTGLRESFGPFYSLTCKHSACRQQGVRHHF